MNARLQANVLRDWQPGWRPAIAVHIAVTSAIPARRKRHSWWPVVCAVVAVVVMAWL